MEWLKGKITDIKDETPSTKRFFFELPEIERFEYQPGQFVTLELPISDQKPRRMRSYSIASAPNGTNTFELVIVLLKGGAGTTYLFNEIKVGDEIPVKGPLGKFFMPKELNKDLFLICTGTGIAPFRSMINYIHRNHIAHKDIYMIAGCRFREDVLYFEELKKMQEEEAGFHYYPVFSRVPEEELETGMFHGYVHPIYEKLLEEKGTPEADFYLCGWKNMINEARTRLAEKGFSKADLHFELFG